jgi:hypothetical protein
MAVRGCDRSEERERETHDDVHAVRDCAVGNLPQVSLLLAIVELAARYIVPSGVGSWDTKSVDSVRSQLWRLRK